MLEQYLRTSYERRLLIPMVNRLHKIKFPTNLITLLSCLTGLAAGLSLYRGGYIDAVLLILISGYLDTLDGVYARRTNQVTALGGLYDILSDRIVEAAIVIGLFSIDPSARAWPAMMMMASILVCVTSFLIVGVLTPNNGHKSFHYSPGLIERLEAFAFFIAMICLPQYFTFLAISFNVLVLHTANYRVQQFKKDFVNGNTALNTAK